jgi:hypothetical protein
MGLRPRTKLLYACSTSTSAMSRSKKMIGSVSHRSTSYPLTKPSMRSELSSVASFGANHSPDEMAAAESNLTRLSCDLIDNKAYSLAAKRLNFACSKLKKFSNEAYLLVFLVNRAQAYKWRGDEERYRKTMHALTGLPKPVCLSSLIRSSWKIGTEQRR